MRILKKKAYVFAIFLMIMLLSACSGRQSGGTHPFERGKVALEDYQDLPICLTENGVYYNQATDFSLLGVHYVDNATGKDVLLCAKPECRHDGNEFCIATNKKYMPFQFQIYDGALFLGALCLDNNTFSVRLVRIALDGSSLEEIATLFTSPLAAGSDPSRYLEQDQMILHRGKAFFHVCTSGDDEVEDTLFYGTAVYDLNSGEINYLNGGQLSKENPAMTGISARGDAFYFITMDGKKRILHRFHLEDGTDEPLSLLTNFTGEYAVMDNGNIYYLCTLNKKLALLYTDGINSDLGNLSVTAELSLIEESLPPFVNKDWITEKTYHMEKGLRLETEVIATSLQTDGKFLYVFASKPKDVYGKFTFTLPEEYADLMYYSDPKTGDHLRVVDEEKRLVYYPTMRYGLSKYQQTVIVYDSIAQRRRLLFPVVTPPGDDLEGISNGYEFIPYVSKDKICYEINEIHDYNVTKKHYLTEDLEDFLGGTPFPRPFITLNPN